MLIVNCECVQFFCLCVLRVKPELNRRISIAHNDSIPAAQFAGAFRAEGPSPLPAAGRQTAAREEDPWLSGRWEFYGFV